MENRKESDNKRKVLMLISAVIVALFFVVFALYKIFVTPKVIVGLALNNAKNNIIQSVDFFTDMDEKDVVQRIMKKGGKTEMDITVSKSAFFEGINASVVSNSDLKSTVTEINLYSKFKIDVYKDKEHLLINTPIPGGNFEVKLDNMDEEISNSVFRDDVIKSDEAMMASGVVSFVSGGLNNINKLDEIKNIIMDIDIEKGKSENILIGSKTQKANVYIAHLKSEDMDKIISMLKAYCEDKLGIRKKYLEKVLNGLSTDCDVKFKIKNFKLYEINIETPDNKERTISFTGEKNMFDNIIYYENGDVKNAVRRHHNRRGNMITEKITIGDDIGLNVKKTNRDMEIQIGSDDKTFIINASGKKIGDNCISYDTIDFGLEDKFIIMAQNVNFYEKYDEDFSFGKARHYINLFKIGEREWNTTSRFITESINKIKNLF